MVDPSHLHWDSWPVEHYGAAMFASFPHGILPVADSIRSLFPSFVSDSLMVARS